MHTHPFRDLLGSLQWGNTDQQTWEKGKTRRRGTKTGTRQYQKGLGQDSGTYPRLFALLPPSTGENLSDRYLLFPGHNARVPWAAPLSTSRAVSAHTEQKSSASSSASTCSTPRGGALAQPRGRNHSVTVQLVSKVSKLQTDIMVASVFL